jgi:hypothetical protein
MTPNPWLTPPVIVAGLAATISLIAAAASWWAAFVNYRLFKRQKRLDQPAVNCSWQTSEGEWLRLWIEVENPTQASWRATAFEVKRPRDSVAVSYWNARSELDIYGDASFSADVAAANAARTINLSLEVQPSGSQLQTYKGTSRRGDTSGANVYIRRSQRKPNSDLHLVLRMESLEPVPRHHAYRIRRKPPAS